MKKYLAMLTFILATSASAATPTFAQVEQAMASKDYETAKVMMEEILRKRPESVRAHTLNATLIVASGGDKKDAEEEMSAVNKLKGNKEILVIANREPESNFARNMIVVLCIFVGIIGLLLAKAYANIRSRNKTKSVDKQEEGIGEADPSNYSTEMTNHQI